MVRFDLLDEQTSSIPGVSLMTPDSLQSLFLFLPKHSNKSMHTILEVRQHATNHQKSAWLFKVNNLDTILGKHQGIEATINPMVGVGYEWSGHRPHEERRRIDIRKLRSIVVNEDVMKPSNDEVYRSSCSDFGFK